MQNVTVGERSLGILTRYTVMLPYFHASPWPWYFFFQRLVSFYCFMIALFSSPDILTFDHTFNWNREMETTRIMQASIYIYC